MNRIGAVIFLVAYLIATSQSFPVDYESDEVSGNAINARRIESDRDDYQDYGTYNYVTSKRGPEVFVGVHKKNVISALQAKMRRSKMNDVEDKLKFAPVLSVDAFGNLNGFFDNLATNLNTMESRSLLPNQVRLFGENENRPRDVYGHSAAFINSVRAYKSPNHIRKLANYQPDSHRNSNFYDPVLARIGLGK